MASPVDAVPDFSKSMYIKDDEEQVTNTAATTAEGDNILPPADRGMR
jgi:hypothetical protein